MCVKVFNLNIIKNIFTLSCVLRNLKQICIDCITGNLNRVLVLTDNPGQCALASYLHRIRLIQSQIFLRSKSFGDISQKRAILSSASKVTMFWSDMKCQVLIEKKYSLGKGQISKFRPKIVLNVFLLAINREVKTYGMTIVDIEIFLMNSSKLYLSACFSFSPA